MMLQVPRLTTIVILFVAGALSAQWDMGGANAILKVEGGLPSSIDATGHNIVVPIGSYLDLTFDSGSNPAQGIILLTSAANPNGVDRIPTPFWGGSIDVGNGSVPAIQIVADGIGGTLNPTIDAFFRTSYGYQAPSSNGNTSSVPSQLEVDYLVPTSACGSRIAWQAIISDPTNPPFNIDNTQCGDTNFLSTIGNLTQLVSTGDDGCVRVQFATGHAFPFHGQLYTDMWVSGNGAVFFGGPGASFASGPDSTAFVNGPPGIAAWLNDWNIAASGAQHGIIVQEFQNHVTITWGHYLGTPNQVVPGIYHAVNPSLRAEFSLTLQLGGSPSAPSCFSNAVAGQFEVFIGFIVGGHVPEARDGIMGHTPGGLAIASSGHLPAGRDLSKTPSSVLTQIGIPMIEEHRGSNVSSPILGWDGQGSPRAYNNFAIWGQNGVYFAPDSTGQFYYSNAYYDHPFDVRGVENGTFSNAPGTVVTVIGKFGAMVPAGGQVLLPTGPASSTPPYLPPMSPAQNLVIGGGSGPYYTNEQLTFVVPPGVSPGNQSIRIMLGSTFSWIIDVLITQYCTIAHPPITLPDDGSVPVTTTVPVTMYGQSYTTIHVCSNGTINMTAGHSDYTETMAEFFGGNGTNGNANVAYLYGDLNPGGPNSGSTWTVTENLCAGTVAVTAANMKYYNSGASAGTYVVTFGASGQDSVRFDFQGAQNDPTNSETPIIGYGNGVADGPLFDLDLDAQPYPPSFFLGTSTAAPAFYQYGLLGPYSFARQLPSGSLTSAIGTTSFTVQNDGAGFLTVY